jgi:hypothetical protein
MSPTAALKFIIAHIEAETVPGGVTVHHGAIEVRDDADGQAATVTLVRSSTR